MPEGKDSLTINPADEHIGGYPVTSGPIDKQQASNRVFFVDTTGAKTGTAEGAAKVGKSSQEPTGAFTTEALLHTSSKKTLAPNRRHIIPGVIDYGTAPVR